MSVGHLLAYIVLTKNSLISRRIQKRENSLYSSQLSFTKILSRSSYDSVLRPSLRKSLKHMDKKYKKNSCSTLQLNSSPRYQEYPHRLSLDLPIPPTFLDEEDVGTIREIARNQPMSSKRKRSRRYGLSFQDLADASTDMKKPSLDYQYMDQTAVSTF